MRDVLGANLSSMIAISISPMALIGLLFLLIVRGRSAAAVWTLGWMCAVFAGTGLAAVLGDSAAGDTASGDSGGVNWVAWVLALLFLALSASSFRRMPKHGEKATEPGWLKRLSAANMVWVFGLGLLIMLINAKNTALYVSMGVSVADASLTGADQWLTVLVITLISSCTALLITGAAYLLGDQVKGTLNALHGWLLQHNSLVMGMLFLLLGVSQLGTAIASV